MYRFSGKASSLPWHKLRIEIQMRTKLQHAWATAVETVDAFTAEDLKFGKGTSGWRRFFQLMGSVHAHIEKTALVPGTPKSLIDLKDEVISLERRLQVVRTLRSYLNITQHISKQQGADRDWFLIKMFPYERRVTVERYRQTQFSSAKRKLAEAEKEFQSTRNQAALVATRSISELKKAYPNYFADTTYFTSILENFVGGDPAS
jgi:hypothetical protein